MHKKWETVLSKREHNFMGHSHWKISRSVLFFVIAFLWIVEAAQLLFILYHCVAIFLILKNCQVSVIFCHCFSLNSGSRSIAVYFVSLCPGNFLILKNCQVSVIFCHCFSLNSGSHSIAVYFVIRWCPGHLWFLHQVFFHWPSLAWFCTRFLHQVFFLWHSRAWFCTRFKLWKWNCSAIWHNLSSFRSNLQKNVVQSYCLCTKSERLYLCVCSCPPVMRGDTVNHALTSTSSPPPVTSPPYPGAQ